MWIQSQPAVREPLYLRLGALSRRRDHGGASARARPSGSRGRKAIGIEGLFGGHCSGSCTRRSALSIVSREVVGAHEVERERDRAVAPPPAHVGTDDRLVERGRSRVAPATRPVVVGDVPGVVVARRPSPALAAAKPETHAGRPAARVHDRGCTKPMPQARTAGERSLRRSGGSRRAVPDVGSIATARLRTRRNATGAAQDGSPSSLSHADACHSQHAAFTRGRWLAVVLVAAFLALLAYGLLSKGTDDRIDQALSSGPRPGGSGVLARGARPRRRCRRALAAAVGSELAGDRLSLAQLRGVPVVLNMWASWCSPCREEAGAPRGGLAEARAARRALPRARHPGRQRRRPGLHPEVRRHLPERARAGPRRRQRLRGHGDPRDLLHRSPGARGRARDRGRLGAPACTGRGRGRDRPRCG